MKNINIILSERFKNKNFEKEYHRTATFFRLASELLMLRKKRGITQKQLAEKVGTVQAVVSRLENASVKASLETIVKLAEALDAVVDVRLIPLEEVRKDTEDPSEENAQLQQDAERGIVYFHADQTKQENSKWINAEAFSGLLSISNKPSLAPISKKAKVRKYA
jgi:transcriptional regulator with XRE-family HTH domain